MIDRWNEWRTGTGGVILFYSYLVAIIVAGVMIGLGAKKLYQTSHEAKQAAIQAKKTAAVNRRLILRIEKISADVKKGQCASKKSNLSAIKRTREFLKDNPNGTDGLTPAILQRSIVILKAQVEALKDVHCN